VNPATELLPWAVRQTERGSADLLLEAIQTLDPKPGPPPFRGAETLDKVW